MESPDGLVYEFVLGQEITSANLPIDKQAISEVAGFGLDRPMGSIFPLALEFALPLKPFPCDAVRAKHLLAEGGYPHPVREGE